DTHFFPGGGIVGEAQARQTAFERDWKAFLSRVNVRAYNFAILVGLVTPAKRLQRNSKSRTGPLVVVIPSVENVPANVLRRFVLITSTRVKTRRGVPIFFVFGVTSTEDLVLESRCDAQTLSRLITKRFHMRPPSVFLDAIFAEVWR
ncbi:unnamed protein product, partial [Hydatigera taeniaeformis]|uniref:ORC3_N domain-containing protein n=1 Tax=Hydatigena taeniaeformis TaxID=6205 RepID=A0A0R3WRJ8_HYDTA